MDREKMIEINEAKIDSLSFNYKEFRARFVYYIIALNVACIGFTVTQTTNIQIAPLQLLLFIAVVFWSISFGYGVKVLNGFETAAHLNIKQLRLKRGGGNLDAIEQQKFAKIEARYSSRRNILLYFFITGCILFLSWHILKINANGTKTKQATTNQPKSH